MVNANRHWRNVLYLLFAISGFSGLIYESIWSHYLKLFLGHAAYAQTLVLAIFMGGMAIGAWLASRFGMRWKNLLAWYAATEGAIGICALVFHQLFVSTTAFAYNVAIPALGSASLVTIFKWTLGAALITPQSILLGTTFPLMSAGLIRRHPSAPGESLAMLYFTNSLGAAIGVLVSGFVLIEWVGLPGTIFTGGLINIALAVGVWLLARRTPEPVVSPTARPADQPRRISTSWHVMIAVALLTGCASFIYEIGWLRMLSLVLGSSTHAFELMLSAFILGLALGGFWIRRRIDALAQPKQFLGWVQIVMGLLALGTVLAYNSSFDLMKVFMSALARTEDGYVLFNLASHSIALLIMVPVAFCAGTTLPLITHILLRGAYGEKSIGSVYAANTAGAIIGVFFAVHVGLTVLGLKGLIATGAAIDMILGIVLLSRARQNKNWQQVQTASLLATIALTAVLIGVKFDPYRMASGVYRTGGIYSRRAIKVLFHKDGKTASVDLLEDPTGKIEIATNGKPDATINMPPGSSPSPDESTMIVAGAVPLLLRPQARTAANIGMGSGLTTHVLLSSPNLERVDTIEIEPVMIEAARGFRPRVERAFSDPRSHFYIDDAKTFFSSHRSRYDIIVSEPSNPWVSGVASLFSDEFYRRVRTHLNAGGLFVQWLQLYEIDVDLVSSVMKAVDRNFADYALFTPNNVDLLIVATPDGTIPPLPAKALPHLRLQPLLDRIGIRTLDDLKLRRLGDRATLGPLFEASPLAANSDYYPVLDLNAVRTRFMRRGATDITLLGAIDLPVLEMLDTNFNGIADSPPTPDPNLLRAHSAYVATTIRDWYITGRAPPDGVLEPELLRDAELARRLNQQCGDPATASLWLDSASHVMDAVIPYLKPLESEALWRRLRAGRCFGHLSQVQRDVFALLGAIARRDGPRMGALAERLLVSPGLPYGQDRYLLSAGMLGYLAAGKPQQALRLWTTYARRLRRRKTPDVLFRLLWAQSVHRIREREAQVASSKPSQSAIQSIVLGR